MKKQNKADNPLRDFRINLTLFGDGPAGDPGSAAPASPSSDPAPAPAPVASTEGVVTSQPTTGEPSSQPGQPSGSGNPLLDYFKSGGASQYDPSKIPGANPAASVQPQAPVVQPAQPAQPAQPVQTEPPAVPPSSPATPGPQDWTSQVPDKFKNPDGSVNVEALVKSYTHLEPKLTEQGRTISELTNKVQSFSQQPQQFQPGQDPQQMPGQQPWQQQPQQPSEPQITPEQVKEINEKFVESLLDPEKNPVQALSQIIKDVVTPMVAPVQEKIQYQDRLAEWNQKVDAFKANTSDFADLEADMTQIINEMGPYLATMPDPLQAAYDMAKGRKAQNFTPQPPPTLEEMLANPDNIEKIVQNPQVQQMILSQTAAQIQNGAPPVVMASQPGGTPPAAPSTPITNAKEATKAAAGFFSRFIGGGS
ncbi:hypothetical protein [Phosphitispora fastidiosa]|uniref:hypothetical protein n=1 Tax=Phosphitispora fastidiosa TaxID=2837202 RepID=UPI001E4AE24A|nr:hypothetical protein [Phosphitispora fastidiosa]MBU7006308.1 hypothetical protein [Phosphitispora fastidiosa]